MASIEAAPAAAGSAPTPMEVRLWRMESIEAARIALVRYAAACDAQDLTAVGDLFLIDALLEVPGRQFRGRDEIVSFFRRAWRDDPSEKTHFITNVDPVWLGGGRVAVSSYFLFAAAGNSTSVLGWGDYRDIIRVADSGALFERKWISIRRASDVRDGWAPTVIRQGT
jgi:hypothetical protein